MSHIEFLGPPGAGKSAIYSSLINSGRVYGGVDDDALRRMLITKGGLKYQFPYRMMPSFIREFFNREFLQYRLGHDALEEFIRKHPDYIEELVSTMNSVSYEPEKIFSIFKRSAERYQLGISTASQQETLCMDESFVQQAFSILWRQPNETFSLERYFEIAPTPRLVVHVDAPIDLCLKRQRERGSVAVAKKWETDDLEIVQKRSQELCKTVAEHLEDITSVITVENTGTVDSAVRQIISFQHKSV